MRRQIIVVFFSLFLGAALPALAVDRGALFKVSGAGHTMLLFGTMHVGQPDFYPLEPRIAQAVAHASTLALEVDPLMPPEVVAKAVREYGMAAPGAALPPALAARLARTLGKAGLDPAALAPLKPWMVAMVLGVSEYARLGYRTDLAVDAHLAGLARAAKVKVLELESIDAQMALFGSLSDADQLRYLDDSLALIESGKQRAEVRQVVDAWSSADRAALDALAARVDQDTTYAGRFVRDVLLDGRNGGLADKLMLLLAREDNAVAAIGVLHLLGKHSVPALLRAKGVTVERVY
ncbi:MAG: TraB/GumN family protein [Pseudomonadota bacterium]|nr:TraB/GumN family protein [Pseudomonadota bacterium]